MFKRTLPKLLSEILEKYGKMAFLSGPRQAGKTTLARDYQKYFPHSLYFNWDNIQDQKKLLKNPYFFQEENPEPAKAFLVVLDEIHKYSKWKNYLKGVYDTFKDDYRFLVTGSGRLDLYKKGGDSLLGRYFSAPLFPLTCGELQGRLPTFAEFEKKLWDGPSSEPDALPHYDQLFELSGFPEPLKQSSKQFYNQWFQERKSLLIREDIRDASQIRNLSLLEMLSHLIPERVGSPLSLNSLREDIGVAFETIREWVLLLERFYYLFRLTPYTAKVSRALKKENKVYLFDWVEIEDPGYRFENMVALHLFKAVQTWKAMGEGDIALYYVRDKDKREVDFLLTRNKKPLCLIECKTDQAQVAPHLIYFQKKLEAPIAVQLVHKPGICKKIKDGPWNQWVISANRWLDILP